MAKEIDYDVVVYFALHIFGGLIGMPLLLLTVTFSRNITRHPLWIGFCGSWILYSLSYTLLLYIGRISSLHAPHVLCLLQAGMVYGAPAMVSVSLFVYVVQIYTFLSEALGTQRSSIRWTKFHLPVMLGLPYLIYLVIAITIIICAYRQPERLLRLRFYCGVDGLISYISPVIVAIFTIGSLVAELLTSVLIYRAFRNTYTRNRLSPDMSIFIRTGVLVLGSFIALGASAAFLASYVSIVPHMVLAILPVSVFLVYGTHSDIMRVWFLCGGKKSQDSSECSLPSVKDAIPPSDIPRYENA